ncbi:MAG: hypothetical protein QM719_10170 [Thermomonas sp.]
MRRHAALISFAFAFALAACGRGTEPPTAGAEPDTAGTAEPSAPTPTTIAATAPELPIDATGAQQQPAPMPEGSFAFYQCDDGAQVEVHFNGVAATVSWPDGRTAQLSQPTSTAEGQSQVYSDRNMRIERAADGLHLSDGDKAETLCTETQASA